LTLAIFTLSDGRIAPELKAVEQPTFYEGGK